MATRTDMVAKGAPNKNAGQRPGQPSRQNVGAQNGGEAAPDELYGVVSVLYHALQGAQTYTQYCDDARKAGDEELVEFFEACRDEESARARMAKSLLAERLEGAEDEDLEGEDEDDEDEKATSDEDDDS